MTEKYIYQTITVEGYHREKPKFKYVHSYSRKQRFINPEYIALQHSNKYNLPFESIDTRYKDLLANQVLHHDWSHMSQKYPNIIGLTDIEIDGFLQNSKNWTEYPLLETKNTKDMEQYLAHIQCYNQDNIMQISQNMFNNWESRMKQWNSNNLHLISNTNEFDNNSTIYITSPKGGLEILSNFAYANKAHIKKRNIPYDWDTKNYNKVLETSSLPYSYDIITDVNDIVYIDDIFMSGEQFSSAKIAIANKLQEMGISNKEMPRIHYMAIAGNMDRIEHTSIYYTQENINKYDPSVNGKEWHTITIGDKLSFDHKTHYPKVSACVFPYSIPDGDHHKIARILYNKYHKFTHREA